MPTVISFSGLDGDSITVEQTPEQVSELVAGNGGGAVRLTRDGHHDGVYVNPGRIAWWHPCPGGAAEPPVVARPFHGPI